MYREWLGNCRTRTKKKKKFTSFEPISLSTRCFFLIIHLREIQHEKAWISFMRIYETILFPQHRKRRISPALFSDEKNLTVIYKYMSLWRKVYLTCWFGSGLEKSIQCSALESNRISAALRLSWFLVVRIPWPPVTPIITVQKMTYLIEAAAILSIVVWPEPTIGLIPMLRGVACVCFLIKLFLSFSFVLSSSFHGRLPPVVGLT